MRDHRSGHGSRGSHAPVSIASSTASACTYDRLNVFGVSRVLYAKVHRKCARVAASVAKHHGNADFVPLQVVVDILTRQGLLLSEKEIAALFAATAVEQKPAHSEPPRLPAPGENSDIDMQKFVAFFEAETLPTGASCRRSVLQGRFRRGAGKLTSRARSCGARCCRLLFSVCRPLALPFPHPWRLASQSLA